MLTERIKDLRNHSTDFDAQTGIRKHFRQSVGEFFCFQFWSLESGVRHPIVARFFMIGELNIGSDHAIWQCFEARAP